MHPGGIKMQVRLLTHTPNPDEVVAISAAMCTSMKNSNELIDNVNEYKERIIQNIKDSHHQSLLEHISFTFIIVGLSRVSLAQLTRHRIASFSVRSMRYTKVNETSENFYGNIEKERQELELFNNQEAVNELTQAYKDSYKHYEKLLELGVSKETARYTLPLSTKTNLILTMNGRELVHFLGLRMCSRAQREIRELATSISKILLVRAPITFKGLVGPRCVQLGYCPEGKKSCGRYPTLAKLKEGIDNGK